MLQQLYNEKIPRRSETLDPSRFVLTPVDSVENGVLVRKSEYQRHSVVEETKQFKYYDFSIQNLLAVGAYKESTVMMSKVSDLDNVDSFAAANQRIDNYVAKAQESQA